MLKRSVLVGLVTGFFISLALIYPVGLALAERYIPGWQNPPATLHRFLQVLSLMSAAVFFALGVIATALLVQPRSYRAALKSGTVAGLSAMLIIQTLILSPGEGMIRMRDVLQLDLLSGPPTDAQVAEYTDRLGGSNFNNIVPQLLLGAGLGALVMRGVFVLYHRPRYGWSPDYSATEVPAPTPNLLRLLKSGRAIRWPDPTESTWRAGIIGGALLGVLFGLEAVFGMSLELGVNVVSTEHGMSKLMLGSGLQAAAAWLSALAPIFFFLWGVLVLYIQRTPPSRYWARVRACTIAGGAAGVVFHVIFISHLVRIFAPLVRLFMFDGQESVSSAMLQEASVVTALAYFGVPVLALLISIVAGAVCTFLQGLVYAWLVPLVPVFRRPVDVGRRAYKEIQDHPAEVLPIIYEMFRQESEAAQAVAHLALRARTRREPAVAQVAAAYHTMVVHPGAMDESVQAMVEVLGAHADWHWRAELGELYRILRVALAVHDVSDVAIITPPPEERTSSLPKPLGRTLDHLANIIRTLKKYERVDDLGGQILFLNNALDAIDHAQEYARQEMHDPSTDRSAYPERQVLEQILGRWQTMILGTIRGLRGRAELTATLETRRLPYADTLNLEVRVLNVGLNVAEDVLVKLEENQAYQAVLGHGERESEILLPGDGRSFEFSLQPTARPADGGDLRVLFEVLYNDSVDPQQRLQLADSVSFLDQLRPFQRIFPIPYVTGTPLQSNEMFVGRGEILQFIRDHLLGAYQNNVIVLHGQRRTGKTSILYQLQRVLHDTHICVLVDMQGKAARGLVDFLYSLADDITYALEDLDIDLDPPEREEFQESPEFVFRSRFLREVTKRLDGRNLLLMFDEFEELQARVEAGKLEPDIFAYLRNLMQHENRVDFIFAGTHKLEELVAEYWSILFNIATYKRISFLGEEEVTRLIAEPVASFGLEYDSLAVRRIYTVTAGQPYFVQLVCHELTAYHNETERNYLTTYDVEAVLETIIERGEAHFKYIWAGATPASRWVLLGAAEHLAYSESITFTELAAWLRQQEQTTLDASDLPDVLAGLERRDILTRTSPGRRRFRFKIDLVRRWILANRRQLRDAIGA